MDVHIWYYKECVYRFGGISLFEIVDGRNVRVPLTLTFLLILVVFIASISVNDNETLYVPKESYGGTVPLPSELADKENIEITTSISSYDNKNYNIWFVEDVTFGYLPLKKGEDFSLTVTSKQKRTIEIGIKSVSTDQLYSQKVKSGTGTMITTIPEDGEYRIYVKNHSAAKAVEIDLMLSKTMIGPNF